VRTRTFLLIFLTLFFALQCWLALDSKILSFDEAMWHYIGRNWLTRGLTPYAGGVDNKSPLIFGIFGVSDALFGLNVYFPRILGIIAQTTGVYFVFRIGKQMGGETVAKFAMFIYGCSLLWYGSGAHLVSGTEPYEILFLLMSIYYAEKLRGLSGLFGAVAIAFRLSGIFGIIASFLYRRDAKSFVSGLLIGVILILGILMLMGIDLKELFRYTISDNFGEGSVTSRSLSWKMKELFQNLILTHLVVLLPGIFFYLLMKKRSNFLVVWFLLELVGICVVGLFAVQHFKQILPAAALMNGFVFAHFAQRSGKQAHLIKLAAIILFVPLVDLVGRISKQMPYDYCEGSMTPPDHKKVNVGETIKGLTEPHDRVLVAGFGAIVQVYSDRVAPTIYFNVTQTEKAKQVFFSQVRASPPKLIAVPVFDQYKQTVQPEIRNFVDSLAATYENRGCIDGYNIFIRRN